MSSLIWVVFVPPLRVRVSTVKQISRAIVSGRDGEGGIAGVLAAAGPHAGASRAAAPSSDPSFSTSRVLKGTHFAPFFTRQARCAPVPENRIQRSIEKKPRSAGSSCPGPNASCSPSARAFSPSR